MNHALPGTAAAVPTLRHRSTTIASVLMFAIALLVGVGAPLTDATAQPSIDPTAEPAQPLINPAINPAIDSAPDPLPDPLADPGPPFIFGITPVFLVDQANFLDGFGVWLAEQLGRPVQFIRRKTYAEITDMLIGGALDAGWLCSFSYVFNRSTLPLIAVPVFRGEPYYESYLIVPADDRTTEGYADLAGKAFAYVEPRSNTGYLYPRFAVHSLGENPEQFFRETFFTWSHTDLVEAVADRFAEAGGVDSYIWESLALTDPALTARTRVVSGSIRFGFPPIVAGALLSEADTRRLTAVLYDMHLDPEGRRLLGLLHLDRFTKPTADLYDSIPPMIQAVRPTVE